MPNFTQCGIDFQTGIAAGNATILQYQYNGTTRGIYQLLDDPPAFITYEGCNKLCGTGSEYYTWEDASATISTWVLPIIGLLLQAPFESNAFWETVFAIAHWVGSPISSLAAILWNISIGGKCSLIVDMSTNFKDTPDEGSQFEQMRDSFYLLSVMNQYSIKQMMPRIEGERLLRVALFSDSLQLEVVEDETRNLVKRRRKLAKTIRESRRKGVVPVFISMMWFLFSLIVSVQLAFGQMGNNATAHNLALGLLLAWLPTLILCSIVDRNPVQAEAIRNKLNKLVDAVRRALLNADLRETYIREIGRRREDFSWTEYLRNDLLFGEEIFTRFAGQGRIRWHYGVAHGILAGIEENYVAEHGRGWLQDSEEARTALVKGPEKLSGLGGFDVRELWQIASSFLIVALSGTGAFILSYFTPTVGLGCRSGGYLIFNCIALGTFIIESLIWRFVPEGSIWDNGPITRFGNTLTRRISRGYPGNIHPALRRLTWWLKNSSSRDRLEALVLRPLECVNTIWLAYIVMAQTFGSYKNCGCMCSTWGVHGGYMDFETQDYYLQIGIGLTWALGTAIPGVVMFLAFTYIVIQWCVQSHLSTENYDSARRGLMRTRKFRKYTLIFTWIPNLLIQKVLVCWHMRRGTKLERRYLGRRSLIWAAEPRRAIPVLTYGEDPYTNGADNPLLMPEQAQDKGDFGYALRPVTPSHSRSPSAGSGRHDDNRVAATPRPFP